MRQCRTYGSVRGALGNQCPYRDPFLPPLFEIKNANKHKKPISGEIGS